MASASESVFDKFRDFDDPDCYAAAVQHARDEKSKNFVVYFGYGAAQIAFDVTAQDVSSILAAPERTSYPIRWMCAGPRPRGPLLISRNMADFGLSIETFGHPTGKKTSSSASATTTTSPGGSSAP